MGRPTSFYIQINYCNFLVEIWTSLKINQPSYLRKSKVNHLDTRENSVRESLIREPD